MGDILGTILGKPEFDGFILGWLVGWAEIDGLSEDQIPIAFLWLDR